MPVFDIRRSEVQGCKNTRNGINLVGAKTVLLLLLVGVLGIAASRSHYA
jgi:hypothetical protein